MCYTFYAKRHSVIYVQKTVPLRENGDQLKHRRNYIPTNFYILRNANEETSTVEWGEVKRF